MPELEPLPSGTPSGWYADPLGGMRARYWDGIAWTNRGSNDVQVKQVPTREEVSDFWAGATGSTKQPWSDVVITTSHELPGRVIREHCGEVFGITVRSRNMVSDWGAQMRNFVGGEVGGYTKMLTDARGESLDRLRKEAFERGADAVISMRMSGNSIADGITELVAYGAAIKTDPAAPDAAPAG